MMERKIIFTILILAVLALATQALVWIFVPREVENDFVGPPRSDYTLTNFTLDALDAQGQHSFTMVAPRLVRKEDDGSIFVTAPNYEIIDNSSNVWKGTSDTAWVNKDGTIMKLDGKVDMHRIPTATVDPVQLLTSDLTITTTAKDKKSATPAPKEKHMETAALATIIDPNHVAHGVGMKANLEGLKDLEFLSDVHWIEEPTNHAQTNP